VNHRTGKRSQGRRAVAALPVLWAAGVLGGCATARVPSEPPLSAEKSAADFGGRSLRDPALHRFLSENLGRDPGEGWDFETLSWAAFYFHPALELARAQWASAHAAEAVAAQRPNPTLTLTPGYNFTREAGISPWMPGVNFDFLFSTAGKRARQVAAARHDTEAARLGVFSAAWQVRSELRKALTDAAIAGRRETQFRAQAEAQRSVVTLLQQRFEAGSIPATDVSVARTALLRAESAAADAHAQALTARARVAAALGIPAVALDGVTLPPPTVTSPYSPATLAAARQEALRSRPDVMVALAKYHSAHAALELEVARQTPDVHLGPGYQYDQGANKWTLALALELPIFHRNEAAIAAAVARRAEAAAQFNVTQAQAIAAIDQALAAGHAAEYQVEHARQLRDESRAQVARVEQRVAAGAGDQLELQTARLDLTTAETGILDAENAAATAAGQLEDALQLPLPHLASLARPDSERSHE
jgi:outer membrane protein TolC